jgi:hypothetical protein
MAMVSSKSAKSDPRTAETGPDRQQPRVIIFNAVPENYFIWPVGRGHTRPSFREVKGRAMLYSLLCYNREDVVWSWTREEDDAVMSRLSVVHEKLVKEGKLGTSLRLLPTTAAATLRGSMVIDGPFAETKEQLLGFYVIDVENLDAALDVAKELSAANPTSVYEVRPVALFVPDARPNAPKEMIRAY